MVAGGEEDIEEHLDKDGDKMNTDEIRECVAPSEGKFREEEVTYLFKHADLNQVSSAVRLCTTRFSRLGKMTFSCLENLVHCPHHMVHCTEITFRGSSKLNNIKKSHRDFVNTLFNIH